MIKNFNIKGKVNKEQLEKIALFSITGIIVIVVLIFFIFVPSVKKIIERGILIKEEKTKLLEAEESIFGINRIRSNLEELELQVKEYKENMPEPTPDWLLRTLNELAAETGINFDRIEPRDFSVEEGSYCLQGLDLQFKADYHSVGIFINKLENSTPFLKIIDISITGNSGDLKKHNVKLTIGAYMPEESIKSNSTLKSKSGLEGVKK